LDAFKTTKSSLRFSLIKKFGCSGIALARYTTSAILFQGATMSQLSGKTIAILATDGFEQSELMEPKKALEDAGAKTQIISLQSGEIKGWKDKNWGDSVKVDAVVGDVSASDFDGLVLPGGQMNPDILRTDKKAVSFVRDFFEQHKPVGAICHGPWLLVEADVIDGRTVTSYHSIQTDVKNAGANWVDQEVVVDQGLVTSRKPDDLPAFNAKLIEEFSEGKHSGQTA
jgi:protease I